MALTHKYVDATIAGDSGTGTTGDPYGDLQYALDQETLATGHVFWLYGAEALAATLDWSTFGVPDYNKPALIRGWNGADALTDGAAIDTGSIDGGDGDFTINSQGKVAFHRLKLFNTGTAYVVTIAGGYNEVVSSCEICDSTGGGVSGTANGRVSECNIHDITGIGISGPQATANYLKNGAVRVFSTAIKPLYPAGALRNIVSIGGASDGIEIGAYSKATALHNSILSAGGSGQGILGHYGNSILNNLIEGFSDTGGKATDSIDMPYHGHNAEYQNATGFDFTNAMVALGDDEAAAAFTKSLFAQSGADTFANRFVYFAPTDEGNVQGGAYPVGCRLDKGAVQHADPAGGGGGGVRNPLGGPI